MPPSFICVTDHIAAHGSANFGVYPNVVNTLFCILRRLSAKRKNFCLLSVLVTLWSAHCNYLYSLACLHCNNSRKKRIQRFSRSILQGETSMQTPIDDTLLSSWSPVLVHYGPVTLNEYVSLLYPRDRLKTVTGSLISFLIQVRLEFKIKIRQASKLKKEAMIDKRPQELQPAT